MGLGGGANKTKLMADLRDEANKVVPAMEKMEKHSKNILDNLQKAVDAFRKIKGGGNAPGGPLAGGSDIKPPPIPGSTPFNPNAPFPGTGPAASGVPGGPAAMPGADIKPPSISTTPSVGIPDFQGPSRLGSLGRGLGTAALLGLSAVNDAINPADYISNDIMRRRAGFFAGIGGNAGAAAGGRMFQQMMNAGTGISKFDAANAAMAGNSAGLMTGLANYSTVAGSAATFSNLVPGAGLEGGMNATAALNQASSVNKLRMIGIKVRGDNGLMRSVKDIANDLWNMLNSQKLGGGKITAADLSLSLQSGNSLDSLLNQYFNGDPVLRQGVVTELYLKAGGNADTKAALKKTGAEAEIAQNLGRVNAAKYNLTNAYTSSGVHGIEAANELIITGANTFAGAVKEFGGIVQAMAFTQTLAALPGAAQGVGAIAKGGKAIFDAIKAAKAARGIAAGAEAATAGAEAATAAAEAGTVAAEVAAGAGAAAEVGAATLGAPEIAGAAVVAGGVALTGAMAYEAYKETTDPKYMGQSVKRLRKNNPAFRNAQLQYKHMHRTTQGTGLGGDSSPYASMHGGGRGVGGDGVFRPLTIAENIPTGGHYKEQRNLDGKGFTTHWGVDFAAPQGTPIYAVKDGVIAQTGYDSVYGNFVTVQHDDGKQTIYGHMVRPTTYGTGTKVVGGKTMLGGVGDSGWSFGNHLHLGVANSSARVNHGIQGSATYDPMVYLAGSSASSEASSGSAANSSAASDSSGAVSAISSSRGLFATPHASLFGTGGDNSTGPGMYTNSGSGSRANYGGVTIHINVPGGSAINEQTLAREVKRILQDEDQIRMAVSR